MPFLLELSCLLFGLDALLALAMGVRYLRRADLMPYQIKAAGRGVADLDPGLRVVCLAMLKAIGGGFLAFGFAALGLTACLWRGERLAGFALAASAAALLAPAYLASSRIANFSPNAGAPTRMVVAAAGVAAVALLALLAA